MNAPNLLTVGGLMFSDCEEGLEEDEIDNNRPVAFFSGFVSHFRDPLCEALTGKDACGLSWVK